MGALALREKMRGIFIACAVAAMICCLAQQNSKYLNMSRKTLVLQKPHKSPLPVQNLLKRQRKTDWEPQENFWVAAMFAGVVVGGVVGGAAGGNAPRRMQPERGLTRSVERKRNESTRSELQGAFRKGAHQQGEVCKGAHQQGEIKQGKSRQGEELQRESQEGCHQT